MFRRYLQRSPVEYLNEYRLKVAGHLLRDTDRSVTDIALSCDLSYFSRTFFETYGETPGDYRKRNVADVSRA